MVVFWIVVACLLVAALLFVLPPLLRSEKFSAPTSHGVLNVSVYQDQLAELEQDLRNDTISQEQYDKARKEIEQRLLEDVSPAELSNASVASPQRSRMAPIVVAIFVPVFAGLLYKQLGQPGAIDPAAPAAAVAENAGQQPANHSEVGAQIEAMVSGLEQRLAQNPDDAEGWLMLGRSYRFLRRHQEAAQAFERAMPMIEGNPDLLADYADTLAMSNNGNLDGKPLELIQKALQLDPVNEQALWLAGTAQYEKGNYQDALSYWRRLQQLIPPESESAQIMAANIAEAETLLSGGGAPPKDASATNGAAVQGDEQAAAPAGNAVVSGVAKLDPKLADKVSPDDTLFIFARAAEGPRMPLAILKLQAKDLPVSFNLNDSMAMMPALALSNFKDVVVGARISKSGSATPQSGDLQGSTQVVKVGSDDLQVVINSAVP